MIRCLRVGISVYPVRMEKTGNGFKNRNWYIQVNNNGKITTYPKSLGTGDIIRGKALEEPIKKTYRHWYKLLNEKK